MPAWVPAAWCAHENDMKNLPPSENLNMRREMCFHAPEFCSNGEPVASCMWYTAGTWATPLPPSADFLSSTTAAPQPFSKTRCTIKQMRDPNFFGLLRWKVMKVVVSDGSLGLPDLRDVEMSHPWCSLSDAQKLMSNPLQLLTAIYQLFKRSQQADSPLPRPRGPPAIVLRGDSKHRELFSAFVNLFRKSHPAARVPLDRQVDVTMRYIVGTKGDIIEQTGRQHAIIEHTSYCNFSAKDLRGSYPIADITWGAVPDVVGEPLLEIRYMSNFNRGIGAILPPRDLLQRSALVIMGGKMIFDGVYCGRHLDDGTETSWSATDAQMDALSVQQFQGRWQTFVAKGLVMPLCRDKAVQSLQRQYDSARNSWIYDSLSVQQLGGSQQQQQQLPRAFLSNISIDGMMDQLSAQLLPFVSDDAYKKFIAANSETTMTKMDFSRALVDKFLSPDGVHWSCILKPLTGIARIMGVRDQRPRLAGAGGKDIPCGCRNFFDRSFVQLSLAGMIATSD